MSQSENEMIFYFAIICGIFLIMRKFGMSKVFLIACIVGSIFSPTQTKVVLNKAIDITHVTFTLVTQHINANSK